MSDEMIKEYINDIAVLAEELIEIYHNAKTQSYRDTQKQLNKYCAGIHDFTFSFNNVLKNTKQRGAG